MHALYFILKTQICADLKPNCWLNYDFDLMMMLMERLKEFLQFLRGHKYLYTISLLSIQYSCDFCSKPPMSL